MLLRFQWISVALWEVLGGIFAVGLIWLILRMIFGKAWKNCWAWLLLAGIVYAFVWRIFARIQSDRYHNIFMLIGLFCIIGLWESFPLPRKWKYALFAVMLALCLGRDLMFNPQDFKILELYRKVEQDVQQHPRTLGVDYGSNAIRDGYYTALDVYGIERPIALPHLLKNLKDNLAVYDGNFDAVYLFYTAKKEEVPLLDDFLTLAPGHRVEKLGACWLDRHHKKQLAVFRYRPAPQPHLAGGGELIFNGDFSKVVTEKEKKYVLNTLGKRMVRLQTEPFELPAGWRFFQSLGGKTKGFVTRVSGNTGYGVRMEADGYLVAIAPPITVKEDKTFAFTMYAEKDSMMQFSRAGNGIGILPVLLLPQKAGTTRRYEVKISPYGQCPQNEIYFWLDHGTVELSDVRLK